jgi:hypothetical protein
MPATSPEPSLLPYGVLTLHSFQGLPGPAPTALDSWLWAPPLPWLTSRRSTLEADLEFLCHNDFIRATYRMEGPGVARVRVYSSVLREVAGGFQKS